MALFQFLEPMVDRDFVDAVIAFANVERLHDEKYVVSEGSQRVHSFFREHGIGLAGDSLPGRQPTVESLSAQWVADQKRLIKMLDNIIEYGGATDATKQQLALGVGAIDLAGNACFRRGRFEIFVKPTRLTLRQWYSVVVALLVENGLDQKIGRCRECNKLFMGWPGKRGKRQQKFCGRPCLDAHKQRAYRNRKRKAQ